MLRSVQSTPEDESVWALEGGLTIYDVAEAFDLLRVAGLFGDRIPIAPPVE